MNTNLTVPSQSEEAKVLIEGNSYFDIIPDATIVLQNIAESVDHENLPSTSVSQNNLNFKINLNEHFMDRGITIHCDVPLIINRAVAAADSVTPFANTVQTKENFISSFFNSFSNFSMSEYGLLNAIDTIKYNLDGAVYTVSDIPEKLRVLSQFYDPEDVQKYFPNSLPDVYNSYELVDASQIVGDNTSGLLKSLTAHNKDEFTIKRPDLPMFNNFTSALDEKYTSRIPTLKFLSWAGTSPTTMKCTLVDQSFFLPFSIFGIPGDRIPLYNVSNIDLSIQLKSNWEQYIFSVKPSISLVNAVKFDNTSITEFKPTLRYRKFGAPAYLREEMSKDKAYAMNYANISIDTTVQEFTMNKLSTQKITSQLYKVNQIPKKIIVYAIPKINGSDSEALNIPNYFARVESLSIKIGSTITNVAVDSSMSLYELCKRNGLNSSKECALYSKGFPVLLNTTDDCGAASGSLVSGTDGQNTISVSASISNLNCALPSVTYVFKTMFIYDSIFQYDPLQKRIQIVESVLPKDSRGTDMHARNLMANNKYMKQMNVLGGSFFSALGNYAAKFGKGAFNVIKAIASNKDGFRDELIKKYQGGAIIYGNNSNVVGGATFDNHMPIGGRSIANWSEK